MVKKCKRLVLVLIVSSLSGCGGWNGEDKIPQVVVVRIDDICKSLMRGGVGFRHVQETASTDRLFLNIQDMRARHDAALRFGDGLLSVDVKSLDYKRREMATGLYGEYVCQCFRLMRKCNVEPSRAMDFLFEGLGRYRASCLDIQTGRLEGESHAESQWRRECARKLRDDYRLTLSIFERFWLPKLSRYLPPEYHDEFRRRLKAFEIPEARPMARQSSQVSEAGEAR